ncbi:MAG: dihydrolipoyl dehydrogenase [Deltaproteobacteria bacterium]|nr:dihydrolipoyl dehydrogenase [Deltaproteobacteria bacterium]
MTQHITVIGAGPGGYAAAIAAARCGASVTLIEQDEVGGTCLHRGCIPSKVMKRTADIRDDLRRSSEFAIPSSGEFRVDMVRLMERKRQVISNQVRGITTRLKAENIRVLKGTGRIRAHGTAVVSHREGNPTEVKWDRLILAPGSLLIEIPSIPFDGDTILSSNEALSLETLPASMMIIGGGIIGCELGSIFASFGVDVTLVETLNRLLPLPSVDEDISRVFQREMKKRKLKFNINSRLESVEKRGNRCMATILPAHGASETVEVEKILVCIGRRPNTSGLGLDRLGIKTEENGSIPADEQMRTSVPNVYAIGDALGASRWMLAHVATLEGLTAGQNAGGGHETMNYGAVPGAVYTTPEVACVGLTENEARSRGYETHVHQVLFRHVGKAHVIGHIGGEAKVVTNRTDGHILGVHMIGPHVTELISEWTLAMNTDLPLDRIAHTMHPHPTLSEISMEIALKAEGRGLYG